MQRELLVMKWDPEACSEDNIQEVISMIVVELEEMEYMTILKTDWYPDTFYNLIKRYQFNVIVKNVKTGERTAIRTFGARFPVVQEKIA